MAELIEIAKSTRHSKITGDFAEGLVLYWLSKHGFESARVDHTGLDLIARNPHTSELMGISVKARSRSVGTENSVLNVDRDNIEKLNAACEAFGCAPYFAFVVDAGSAIRCFIVTLQYVVTASGERKGLQWNMRPKDLERYQSDNQVIMFEFQSKTVRWWKK
jgi:Holliday junction resolvase-like predicted endonuclease